MADKPAAPVTPDNKQLSGITLQPAFWVGAGGILSLTNLDGTPAGDSIAVLPGSFVTIVPPPQGEGILKHLGLMPPEPGKLISLPGLQH